MEPKILREDILPLIREKIPTRVSELENDSQFVESSDLTITETGQTKANNLPTNFITGFQKATNITSAQARLRYNYTDLQTGTPSFASFDLPMVSDSAAGCITAADMEKLNNLDNKLHSLTYVNQPESNIELTTVFEDMPAIITFTPTEYSSLEFVTLNARITCDVGSRARIFIRQNNNTVAYTDSILPALNNQVTRISGWLLANITPNKEYIVSLLIYANMTGAVQPNTSQIIKLLV